MLRPRRVFLGAPAAAPSSERLQFRDSLPNSLRVDVDFMGCVAAGAEGVADLSG